MKKKSPIPTPRAVTTVQPRIHLIVKRPNGRSSDIRGDGDTITAEMLDVAEDLVHTLTTGERPPLKGLYELCALAFGTTRADAKKRLTAAAYGKSGKSIS